MDNESFQSKCREFIPQLKRTSRIHPDLNKNYFIKNYFISRFTYRIRNEDPYEKSGISFSSNKS